MVGATHRFQDKSPHVRDATKSAMLTEDVPLRAAITNLGRCLQANGHIYGACGIKYLSVFCLAFPGNWGDKLAYVRQGARISSL